MQKKRAKSGEKKETILELFIGKKVKLSYSFSPFDNMIHGVFLGEHSGLFFIKKDNKVHAFHTSSVTTMSCDDIPDKLK